MKKESLTSHEFAAKNIEMAHTFDKLNQNKKHDVIEQGTLFLTHIEDILITLERLFMSKNKNDFDETVLSNVYLALSETSAAQKLFAPIQEHYRIEADKEFFADKEAKITKKAA